MSTRLLGIVVLLSVVVTFSPAAATEAPATAESSEPEQVSPQVILETQKPPKYPPAAFAARYTGTVTLEVVVLVDGKIGKAKVLHCTRPKMGFEEAALAAVKQWRFEPGRIGDEPAEVTLRFRLNFAPGGVSLSSETIPGGSSPSSSSGSTSNIK